MSSNLTESAPLTPVFESLVEQSFPSGRRDHYFHHIFTETDNPQLAQEAWRIHAEGYHEADFVSQAAITQEGFMASTIDKSRGDSTQYYLAVNPTNEMDKSSLRKINVGPGKTYRDLPAYELCQNTLWPEGLAELEEAERNGIAIKEIAAMARTVQGRPEGIHELIRHAVHDALGQREAWLFSIVSTTYKSFIKNFASQNMRLIGSDVSLSDNRVKEDIVLKPVIVDIDNFMATLYSAYLTAERPIQKERLRRSFLFMSEGLDERQLGPWLAESRYNLTAIVPNEKSV